MQTHYWQNIIVRIPMYCQEFTSSYSQNDQAGVELFFANRWSKKNLLGACRTASPWKAAILLYWGDSWFNFDVLNGEPALGSDG